METPNSSSQGTGQGQVPDAVLADAKGKDKTVTIVVNGTAHEVPKKEDTTYDEVVTFAYPDYPQHPEITYSVTYTRGHGHKPEGILSPGGIVKVKDGMSFVVNRTGQS